MNVSDQTLFSKRSLLEEFQRLMTQVKDQIHAISKEQFTASSDEQIIDYIYSKLEVIPLTIYPERMTLSEPQDTRFQQRSMLNETIYVEGVITILSIPFSGDLQLWLFKPSRSTGNPPQGQVIEGKTNEQIGVLQIKLVYSNSDFKDDVVHREIESLSSSIQEYLAYVKHDVDEHNKQLRIEISRMVQQRRVQLGATHSTLQKLKIPIVRREGAPDLITHLSLRRKEIAPLPSKPSLEQEFAIPESIYDHTLNVIRHEGISFERAPETFAIHDEEGLRDILLAHLNSHFEGQATGETFRKKGKTDICIEYENRAAFIAECKLWKGRKALHEAIDQLLGYLTWRDVKAALIVFNKNAAGFKQVQESIIGILREHPNYISVEFLPKQSEWRLVLRSQEDPERFITVRVFLFNLYTS